VSKLQSCFVCVVLLIVLASGAVWADWKQWSDVDFVDRYKFKGTVLEDTDLSGIACISPERCLIGADEAHQVQAVRLSRKDKTLRVSQTISLMRQGDEIDIEAIAAEGSYYYITGSHGVAKKTAERQPNRYRIFRLQIDPATGLPGKPEMTTLTGVFRADPILGPYLFKPLQQHGLNIEGLAVRDGRLYVGLRNPNLEGNAFVLEIAADDVFSGKTAPEYTLHRLSLGKGLGIRDIVAGRSCFLILAGNAGSEPSAVFPKAADYHKNRGYWIYAWGGKGPAVTKIGPIPNPPGKAEAMTILNETQEEAMVLILFDGVKKGGPSVYRIH